MSSEIENALAGMETVNQEKLAGLREILGESMDEIIDVYKEDTTARLVEIKQAASSGDLETLYRICHALKSASGNVALDRMFAIALQLELRGKEGNAEGINDWVAVLEEEFNKVNETI